MLRDRFRIIFETVSFYSPRYCSKLSLYQIQKFFLKILLLENLDRLLNKHYKKQLFVHEQQTSALFILCSFCYSLRDLGIIYFFMKKFRSLSDCKHRDVTSRMISTCPANHCNFINYFLCTRSHRFVF